MAVPVDGKGTASVETVKAPPVPGVQKPPCRVGKRFRDRLVALPEKCEETSRPENETRLVAAGLPGREPGGLPQRRELPGLASAAVQALRRLTAMTSFRDPTWIVK
jgi:hypothetical protein